MTRRFVAIIGCLLIALGAGAAHAHGVTLKVHHALAADSPLQTQFLVAWTKKLEEASHGRLRFQLFPASPAPAEALHDQVKQGEVDMAWLSIAPTGRFPAFEKFVPPSAGSAASASVALWDYVRANDLAKKEFDGVRLLGVAAAGDAAGKSAALFVLIMNPSVFKSLSDDLKQIINTHSGAETSAWLGKVLE